MHPLEFPPLRLGHQWISTVRMQWPATGNVKIEDDPQYAERKELGQLAAIFLGNPSEHTGSPYKKETTKKTEHHPYTQPIPKQTKADNKLYKTRATHKEPDPSLIHPPTHPRHHPGG